MNEILGDVFLEQIDSGQFRWRASSDWFQGRGVYGGLIFAAVLKATNQVSDRRVRRLNIDLSCALEEGDATIEFFVEHRGQRSEFLRFTIKQKEKVTALGTVVTGVDRSADFDFSFEKELPPKPSVEIDSALMPNYAQFFSFYPCHGAVPFSAVEPRGPISTGGWIELRIDTPRNECLMVALIDAWWPAILARGRSMRPMGTISFSIDILQSPCQTVGPFYLESSCEQMVGGYASESNLLWDHEGSLLAVARQSVVLIK